MILSTPLREEPVTIEVWSGANLFIRELSGKAGADLIAQCTDADGKTDQTSLVAGIVLATLRNADDPNKALIFGFDGQDAPNPAFRDGLMAIGLGNVMACANASIELSGLGQAAVSQAKNASAPTVVDGSLSASPAN
jgi:hypothetical protein